MEQLDFYEEESLAEIIRRTAELLKTKIEVKAARELAARARGTPRIANRLLRRVRDYAEVNSDGVVTVEEMREALLMLGVDERGLSDADRKYLEVLEKQYGGGPVGVENMAAALTEDVGTIVEVYEPYLMKRGLLKRTPRGRVLVKAETTKKAA